jgi:hypothetical protein
MLHSASNTTSGVPQQLLDAKAAELAKKHEEQRAALVSRGGLQVVGPHCTPGPCIWE